MDPGRVYCERKWSTSKGPAGGGLRLDLVIPSLRGQEGMGRLSGGLAEIEQFGATADITEPPFQWIQIYLAAG